MLLLKKKKDSLRNSRKWDLIYTNNDEEHVVVSLNLINSSLTNKFNVVADLIEDMNDVVSEFSGWYIDLIDKYKDSEYNSMIVVDSANEIMKMAESYIENKRVMIKKKGCEKVEGSLNELFDTFVDVKKASKTSILFEVKDIRAIALSSTALKIYSLFQYDSEMQIPENINRKLYDIFIKPCVDAGTTAKIFELIRSKTYKSSITDRYIWDIIRMVVLDTPENYVMTKFNFLMRNLISILSVEKNPVLYLIGFIDYAIRWLMTTDYRDKVIYGEAFGSSEELYGSGVSKESFHLYCCNDVVAKASNAGMNVLEDRCGLTDLREKQQEIIEDIIKLEEESGEGLSIIEHTKLKDAQRDILDKVAVQEDVFTRARDRIDSLTYLFPPMRILTLPIASKVLEIPYKFLLAAAPKHVILMGIFLHEIGDELIDEYPVLSEFLISCPENSNFLSTRSSYRLRNLEFILNEKSPIFGFTSKTLKFEVMSSICGVLSASKKNIISVIDGGRLSKITYLDLENDVTSFFTKLYSSQLDSMFDKIRKRADEYF